jgi:hypothetical protein
MNKPSYRNVIIMSVIILKQKTKRNTATLFIKRTTAFPGANYVKDNLRHNNENLSKLSRLPLWTSQPEIRPVTPENSKTV